MEQRTLKVIGPDKTFFGKITNTLTKLLIPTQVGFNNIMISIKRNNVIKTYDTYNQSTEKEQTERRYEESYSLYLEALDKFVMDSIYKKVKNDTASEFEKEALSQYYRVTALKESEYLEYKYKKQKYLLELDYESILATGKEKHVQKFTGFYIDKMDSLYKGLLKNYSVKLADSITSKFQTSDEIYTKIFDTLQEYVEEILPIKIDNGDEEVHKKVIAEYEELDRFDAGKFDETDLLEKNMLLLGISRSIFTHSLPLVAAEQCYVKLLKDIRSIIVNSKTDIKRIAAYKMLIKVIEEYNVKLLATKVYWEDPKAREEYKTFWSVYEKVGIDDTKAKEILFIKYDLKMLNKSKNDYSDIKDFYKAKLKEYGVASRTIKNTYRTSSGGKVIKKTVRVNA